MCPADIKLLQRSSTCKSLFASISRISLRADLTRLSLEASGSFSTGEHRISRLNFSLRRCIFSIWFRILSARTDSVEVNGNWHKAPLKEMHGNPRKYSGGIDLGAIETPFLMNEHFAFTDTSIRGSGDCDYAFDIEFEGGMPPYSFFLDEDEFDNIPFEGVCKGAHTIKVEDSEGKVLTWIISVGVGLEENSTGLSNFKLWPNPASRFVNLEFNLAISAPVRIIIFNTMGKQEKMFEYDAMVAGFHDAEMDISGINPGLYFLKIESDKTEIAKLIIQ